MNPDLLPGLQGEIDALKSKSRDTRGLYREVCALLFFGYGITPTAHRLYQLVRRGSMGTPTEVLRLFWQDIRERSRVRLDHPDLPDDLRSFGGEFLSQLWLRARQAADADSSSLREDARVNVSSAQAETASLRDEMTAMRAELIDLRDRLPQLQTAAQVARRRELEAMRELATNQGRIASMTEILRETAQEMLRLRQELALALGPPSEL